MFSNCKSLNKLNLSNFNTNKVEYMNNMFENCESLIKLNISNFKINKETENEKMFDGCPNLKKTNKIKKISGKVGNKNCICF